jgi:hypothetical protein
MATNYNPKIVTENLALALDAGNPKSYPGSGSTWYDLSGNSNNATLYNSPTFSGGIVSWNGTSQYAEISANETSLSFKTEQTVIIWMRHNIQSGRRNPWDQAYGGYGTWTHEQGLYIHYYYGSAGSNTTPYTAVRSATVTRNEWTMMAVTRNSSVVNWYENGTQSSSTSTAYTSPLTTNNIRISRGYAGYWEGDMLQVLAYTRALSASEILVNYEATRGRLGV